MTLAGMPDEPPVPLWRRILGERPDERILRAIFRTLIALTVVVLGSDLYDQMQRPEPQMPTLAPGEAPAVQPFLPSTRPDVAEPKAPGSRELLEQPMTIELVAGGRLEATGTIVPGTAERFAAEIEKRGDYVKTVVLNSPGGSVQDALAMSKLIRERGFDTTVEGEGLCASSCPLVFAGGMKRTASENASIGVHQVIAMLPPGALAMDADADGGMARAQRISAECQRHLVEMGVDPRVWIHAMETPPEQIFYFTPEELVELKLATAT